MHFEMHLLASDIFSFCYNHGINLEIDWVPRSLNDKADCLSKIVDYDYWEIVPKIFQLLDSRWALILSTASPLFTTLLKSQDSFIGCGIQVHLAWTHFFKPGKTKTVGWFHQSSSFLKCLSLCLTLGSRGPFLERPGNLTGPKSYFEIKVSRKVGCVLT